MVPRQKIALAAGGGTLGLTTILGALGGAGVFDSAAIQDGRGSKTNRDALEGARAQTEHVDQDSRPEVAAPNPSLETHNQLDSQRQEAPREPKHSQHSPGPEDSASLLEKSKGSHITTPPSTSTTTSVKSPQNAQGRASGAPKYVFRIPGGQDMVQPTDRQLYLGQKTNSIYYGPDFNRNGKFNLGIHRCFERFFPGAWKPEMNSDVQETAKPANFDNWKNRLLLQPDYDVAVGQRRGCAIMNLAYKGHLFLFKSEVALKNDRIGMVLWSGIKHANRNMHAMMTLQFIYHLTFLTRNVQKNEWSTVASFSWGTESEDQLAQLSELTIKFPDQTTVTLANKSDVKDGTQEIRKSYAGLWDENIYGDVPALGLAAQPYHVEDNWKSARYGAPKRTIDPTIINGYGAGADAFLDETLASMTQAKRESKSWRWKKLVQPDGSLLKLNITSVVEAWYRPFRRESGTWEKLFGWIPSPVLGQWENMSDYCNRNKQQNQAVQVNHICYAPEGPTQP